MWQIFSAGVTSMQSSANFKIYLYYAFRPEDFIMSHKVLPGSSENKGKNSRASKYQSNITSNNISSIKFHHFNHLICLTTLLVNSYYNNLLISVLLPISVQLPQRFPHHMESHKNAFCCQNSRYTEGKNHSSTRHN